MVGSRIAQMIFEGISLSDSFFVEPRSFDGFRNCQTDRLTLSRRSLNSGLLKRSPTAKATPSWNQTLRSDSPVTAFFRVSHSSGFQRCERYRPHGQTGAEDRRHFADAFPPEGLSALRFFPFRLSPSSPPSVANTFETPC